MGFGQVNATITKLYQATEVTKDDYGSPILASPNDTLAHKGWFEEIFSDTRQTTGDAYKGQARFICNHSDLIIEGDIIEITPMRVGSETVQSAKNWRIERISKPSSFIRLNSRIRRMEMDLIREES